jgi:hypothetical protein
VLALRGPDQSPHRRVGEVGHVLVGAGRDRPAGEHDQPRRREALVGEPGLDQRQRVRDRRVAGGDRVRRGRGRAIRRDHHVGRRGASIERRGQRGEIGVALERAPAGAGQRERVRRTDERPALGAW